VFVDTFIRRPILASVCSLVIILAGAIAIPTLPIAQFPELAPPQVAVTAFYNNIPAGKEADVCKMWLAGRRVIATVGKNGEAPIAIKREPRQKCLADTQHVRIVSLVEKYPRRAHSCRAAHQAIKGNARSNNDLTGAPPRLRGEGRVF